MDTEEVNRLIAEKKKTLQKKQPDPEIIDPGEANICLSCE